MYIDWWILFSIFIVLALSIFVYAKWEAGYFKRRGIKSLPYTFPIIGNMSNAMFRKEHIMETVCKVYNEFPDEKYVGFMQINKPVIMIRDLELIKQIAIKDFDHFLDHATIIDEHADSLIGNSLFILQGDKWRDMRATLSPAFTSSKMKTMFTLINEIGIQMTEFYMKKMNEPEWKERGFVEIEMKEAFTRYTNDVIASSAFGLVVNSFEDRNNQFYEMGKFLSDFSGFRLIKFLMFFAFPKIMKFLGIKLFKSHVKEFFFSLVLGTMKKREENGIIRPDMIQILMEAKKGSLKHEASQADGGDAGFATVEESSVGRKTVKRKWTDDEIVAQAVVFFGAGFESVSSFLCFVAHELTINPDIQKKLQNEIDSLILEKEESLSYNDLMKLKYLDMVVTETLRLWPPAINVDRKCIRSYTFPPSNDSSDKEFTMKPNELVWIPIHAIHLDPKYYPNPKKFDPERFSDENKVNINPKAYLPFGVGPRNCIGSRFALMKSKAVIFHLLSKFDFVATSKTENPLQISKKTFNVHAANGFWIGLQPRNK